MLNRRQFLQLSSLSLMNSIPLYGFTNFMGKTGNPHFFLQIIMEGGIDNTYTFDARPLEFTQKELLQNYTGENPDIWQDFQGRKRQCMKATSPKV